LDDFNWKKMTKRVCELSEGDVFLYGNRECIVSVIKDNRVYYKSYINSTWNVKYSFGAKSKMKVEIIPTTIKTRN
jgi:hypothetical protein